MAAALFAASTATAFVAGGGPARTDCFASWQVTSSDVTANHGPAGVDCQDGDPACDVDGQIDGTCTFGVSACVAASDVAGCSPESVTSVAFSRRTAELGVTAPALPAVDPACGPAAVVRVPLRATRRGARPSRPLVLSLVATTASGRDHDVVRLRCVPNAGAGQCPENPSGGPRELTMTVALAGTDLDNGVTGLSHGFPVPGGSTLRMCVSGCDATTDPTCVQDEAATDQVQSATFGPPLPLFAAGVPTCIVNRFATPSITGGTADLTTGAVAGELHLLSDVYVSTAAQVCPTCSGDDVGHTGVCTSGRRAGQACRTQSIMPLNDGSPNGKQLAVSSDCPPSGQPVGTLELTLPLTTSTAMLEGPQACGARQDACGAGTCDAACTGSACIATTADGECIDAKGGLSQMCCSNATQTSCFPGSDAGGIVRTGSAGTPTPAWPDPTYPKTAAATLVSTFCEPATGSILVDTVTGLPGPGALVLPIEQTWQR